MAYGPIKTLGGTYGTGIQVPSATTGSALYYSPHDGVRTLSAEIATIILHNTNSAAETVQVFMGGTGAVPNRILSVTLAANDTFEFSPKVPVVLTGVPGNPTGVGIWASSTTASKVNMFIYGREEV